MLDERTLTLLNIINEQCGKGGYKVFEIEDLISSFPTPYLLDRQGLNESLTILSSREYISIKYQDEQEICLAVLSKGRLENESRLEREIEKMQLEKRYFLYSFLGSLSGGVITFILALIFSAIRGL